MSESMSPGVGFSSDAALRFAGCLKCDRRTVMKSFLKKIARELTGNLHKNPTKFPENSRAIFFEKRLHYCTIMAPQESCEKLANRRAASDEKPTPGVLINVDQDTNSLIPTRYLGVRTV